jgi:predicted metal-binding membrane protein
MISERASQQAFFGTSALLFIGSAALTIAWCASMPTMGEMPMPSGWTMSMAWMRTPGQTWLEAAVLFLAMWVVMMMAMMLPSLVPMLWRYRQVVGRRSQLCLGGLTVIAALGYFFVWTLAGLVVFPLGVTFATAEMQWPALAGAVPIVAGVVVLIAGALQFTPWKAHHLTCCREEPMRGVALLADAGTAWRQGVRFGLHCGLSCANLTMVLLVVGVMNLRAMAVITLAITAERLTPAGEHVARATGFVLVGAALILIARAARLP